MHHATRPARPQSHVSQGEPRTPRGDARANARQWEYTRVTRLANLARHAESCTAGCQRTPEVTPAPGCTAGQQLARSVLQAREMSDYWSDQASQPVREPSTLF